MRARLIPPLLACLLSTCAPSTAHAQLKSLETQDLRLLYLDPPDLPRPVRGPMLRQLARVRAEALRYTTLGADHGPPRRLRRRRKRIATAVPRDFIKVDIAPLRASPTRRWSPNERMNWLMNHELVHVAAADQAAASRPLLPRRSSGGRCCADRRRTRVHPYWYYLTSPARRRAALVPRGHRGLHRDLDGRRPAAAPRARYDEMVFRAMVRDGSHFYDPLGLGPRGRPDRLPGRGRTPTSTGRAS